MREVGVFAIPRPVFSAMRDAGRSGSQTTETLVDLFYRHSVVHRRVRNLVRRLGHRRHQPASIESTRASRRACRSLTFATMPTARFSESGFRTDQTAWGVERGSAPSHLSLGSHPGRGGPASRTDQSNFLREGKWQGPSRQCDARRLRTVEAGPRVVGR